MDDHFVSLRQDLRQVPWTGIQLLPGVDIQFRIEPCSMGHRQITVRLVRQDGAFVELITGTTFSAVDFETSGPLVTVLKNCIGTVEANEVRDEGIELIVSIINTDRYVFRLYNHWLGRPRIERWDWFVDPALAMPDSVVKKGELYRQRAA